MLHCYPQPQVRDIMNIVIPKVDTLLNVEQIATLCDFIVVWGIKCGLKWGEQWEAFIDMVCLLVVDSGNIATHPDTFLNQEPTQKDSPDRTDGF